MNGFANSSLMIALKAEFFSLLRRRSVWFLLFLPPLVTLLNLLFLKLKTVQQAIQSGTGEAGATGFGYMVDGFSSGLITLYLLFTAYAGLSFAMDRDQGVVRHLIIRSISRRSFVTAKFLWLLILALVSVVLIFSMSIAWSAGLWDLGPVVEDGYEIIGAEEIVPEIRIGLLLALLPLPMCLSVGLLISVCAHNAVRAIVSALGIYIGFDLLKGAFGSFAHYISLSFPPTINDQSYLKDVAGIARGFSDILIDEKVYQLNLWLPLPQAAIVFILTLLIVNRKTL